MRRLKTRIHKYILGVLLLCIAAACTEPEGDKLTTPLELTVERVEPDSVVMHCLALDFQVVDFFKWKSAFDQNDSLRKAFGLRSWHIFRKVLDTNQVLVMMKVTDVDKASAYSTDPEVTAQMKDMGVVGVSSVKILNAIHLEDKTQSENLILIQHEVEDYKAWAMSFEDAMSTNENIGIKALCRLYVLDNPNMVSVLLEVSSFELAEQIMSSPTNISSMKESGAISEPIITMLTFIE